MDYEKKYLKYKTKYLQAKMIGSGFVDEDDIDDIEEEIWNIRQN